MGLSATTKLFAVEKPGPAVDVFRYLGVSFGFAVIREESARIQSHAYVRRHPEDHRAPLACHRRAGQGPGPGATQAARLLQGKHKASYTPFIDTGDHVVIVNVAAV